MVQLMSGRDAGMTVRLTYAHEKERGALARSVGRRAAHRDFKVDIRDGDGFLSVRKVAEQSEPAKPHRSRSRQSAQTGES